MSEMPLSVEKPPSDAGTCGLEKGRGEVRAAGAKECSHLGLGGP